MTVTGGFDALVGGSFLFASSVFPQDKRIDVEDRGEDCYHDKQEENAKREARIGIEVRVQQDYRTGHESGKASDDGEREIMGEESQSTVGVHSEREGKSVQGVRMAGLGPQSESQNGAQRMAMLESVIFALVIGRAIDFVDRLQPLEGSIRPEITEEGSASKAQIDDPGSGSSRDTSTTEPEPLSKSIELSQIVPRRKLPTIHETGESSRGKTLSRESVRLVTCWNSPFAHRVAISLREKGVRYGVIEESTLNKNVRTLNANPLSKRIPILMHGGRVISESRIIMEYIDEAWPDSSTALLPIDPFERSAARYWSDYIDQKIAQRLLQHVGVNVKEVYDTINDALIGLNKAMTVISEGNFFMGDRLGFVDIMFAPIIPWLQVLQKIDNYNIPDAKMCPRLHQWLSVLEKHPSVKPSLDDSCPKKLRAFIVEHFRESRR